MTAGTFSRALILQLSGQKRSGSDVEEEMPRKGPKVGNVEGSGANPTYMSGASRANSPRMMLVARPFRHRYESYKVVRV